MIIVPELEAVVIQPPRTGSTSIKEAVLKKYPEAFSPYRHMEIHGTPAGYDVWRSICIIRHPLERLHSLYRFMGKFSTRPVSSPSWAARLQGDVDRSFEDWLTDSREVFTDPWEPDGGFIPRYLVMDRTPIARKSQRAWVGPCEKSVTLLKLENPRAIEACLGIDLPHLNAAMDRTPLETSRGIEEFLGQYHAWDLEKYA
jgi:hypothetical protein